MASSYLEKLQIPNNFEEILHDLIKETLRVQPSNIEEFSLEFFMAKKENRKLNYQPIEVNSVKKETNPPSILNVNSNDDILETNKEQFKAEIGTSESLKRQGSIYINELADAIVKEYNQ